ncbi:hypothetical protein CK485_26600 [Streptomyces sp. ICBB 8177]|nr:hypothetical protein CK485_26600 [Streptomyces sp. ICBB 8177]
MRRKMTARGGLEMAAASRASGAAWDWRVNLLWISPFAVLAGCVLVVFGSNPHSHYGLLLAVVPLLSAAVHNVGTTTVVGGACVAFFALTHYRVPAGGTAVWLVKLGIVAAAALIGVLISRARLREQELTESRAVALTLQRGLLPHDVKSTSAVEVHHRYLPADGDAGVGGDWFDVVPLSGARVALVVGDVAGHGVHAAATMGRLRTAVHTLADLDLAPDELLARLDDLVVRLADEEADRVIGASCLYVVYDPISRRCTIARAGHPAPAVVRPGGRADFPRLPDNPPLGLGGTGFECAELTLPEGTLLALYTDGLLALRAGGPEAAQEAMARVLRRTDLPLASLCDGVLAALPSCEAEDRARDDIALLLARTRVVDPRRVACWEFPATPEAPRRARALTVRQLDSWHLADALFPTELVVSELVTNAVRYGGGPVRLRLIYDHALICEVSDASSTSPHLRHPRLMDEGGRGLHLVGCLTDRWGTRYGSGGKTIWAERSLAGVTGASREPSSNGISRDAVRS